jgi:hypothetical protein
MPMWRPYDTAGAECMIFDRSVRSGPDPQAAPRALLYAALANRKQYNPL